MSVINTNITSLIGQSNLSKSQSALQTSMERLSSGLRINSAKDDAAGQAIANRMTAQITGLAQAQRNANDGISIAQTAEGSLNQVNDNLQRIRELTVQAANGTNSQEDLDSIQAEIDQRLSEIDRISRETDFNGVRVLSDEAEALTIQVGANDGQTITVNLKEISAATLGLNSFDISQGVVLTDSLGASVADETEITISVDVSDYNFTDTETTAPATTNGQLYQDGDTYYVSDGTDFYEATIDHENGVINFNTGDTDTPTGTPTVVDQTDVEVDVEVDLDALEDGQSLQAILDSEGEPTGGYVVSSTDADGNTTYNAAVIDGAGAVTVGAALQTDPLGALDDALMQVDNLRSDLGAVQNRFEDAITNLNTNETNLSAARSRIEDADYAVEVANMTRAQILQQAGTSVLAQANQIPQNVLSLLG